MRFLDGATRVVQVEEIGLYVCEDANPSNQKQVAAGIGELTRQAEQQALDELATLEQTLARTKSDEPRLREAIGDLEAAGALLRTEQESKRLPEAKL